jgi:cytochrome c biogenesis protein CcdA
VADWRSRRVADLWVALALLLAVPLGATLSGKWQAGPAPGFSLVSTGYEDGVMGAPQAFNLSDYRGRTVVLDFMAVTCTTCRTVTEEVLKPLHARHPDAVILSIDTWSDPGSGNVFGSETDADLVRLQQQTNVSWRHARDTDGVYVDYLAISLPKLAVVDPAGQLVYSRAGAQSLDKVEAAVVAAQASSAAPVPALRAGLLGFAFIAGLACALTPCGVGLLPAYVGLLLERGDGTGRGRSRMARALGGGAQAALGIVAAYAALAVLFWAFGDALRPLVPWLAPALGLALAALGLLALAGKGWPVLQFGQGGLRPGSGFAAFGAAYGLAGFACTGPLFLPVLLLAFLQGPGTGLAAFGLYTLAVAGMLVAIAALVAAGRHTHAGQMVARAPWLHKASAAILALGGLVVAWYGAHAYGLL